MNISTDSEKINTLLTRGVAEIIEIHSLREKLESGKQLRIKLGIDPTSPDIHLGRSLPILKLRDFQDLGHQIVLIVGDFTGVVGDTSDKDAERPMLTKEIISENMKNYRDQVGKILDMDKVEFHYNSEWLENLTYREIGEHANIFSVNGFIQRDNIRRRLEAGKRVSLREVLYPIMQGYDSVAIKADVEIGGMDQKFNLLAGRHLQKHFDQDPQNIIMGPLVNGLDGRKMSSSWGNTINLLDIPSDMYGKVMSMHDASIIEYFTLMTRVSINEIEAHAESISGGVNPKDIKMILARTLVSQYHNDEDALAAEDSWKKAFEQGGIPENAKTVQVKLNIPIVDILIREGIVASKTEFKRLVADGAIKFHGSLEEKKIVDPTSLTSEDGALRIGKKRFLKLRIERTDTPQSS
jgi:tyrosyl-tRNA synthetase